MWTPMVSRTRCGILHAAPQNRDRTRHRRSLRPRLCSAPLRKSYALRCVRGTRPLQRLDLHLAEFHHAGAVLQGERSAGVVFGVLHVDGLLAIEHDDEMRSLRGDLVGVPLAGRLRHRLDFGDVDDRAGAVARIRALVEDVDLVADLGVDLVALIAANEDAAVGFLVGPELGLDLEILVAVLADQIREVLDVELVGGQRTVLHLPVGLADLGPVALLRGVEQRDPAVALPGRGAGELKGGGAKQQAGRECRQTLHRISPVSGFWLRGNIEAEQVRVNAYSMLHLRCGFGFLPHVAAALARYPGPASMATAWVGPAI